MARQFRTAVTCVFLSGAFCILQGIAQADTITFEADTFGFKPNGFQSVESDLVRFSASGEFGALVIGENFGAMELIGTRGLVVFGSPDTRLIMDFSVPIASLGLFYGNDEFFSTIDGDRAFLMAYQNDVLIGQTSVLLNRNDIIDQSITFAGAAFNRATFHYTAGLFLAETVDNITFQPVPEPSTVLLAGTGLALVLTMARRRRAMSGR